MNKNMEIAAGHIVQAFNWKVFSRKGYGHYELTDITLDERHLEMEVLYAVLNWDYLGPNNLALYKLPEGYKYPDGSDLFVWPCGNDGRALQLPEDQFELFLLGMVSDLLGRLSIVVRHSYYQCLPNGEEVWDSDEASAEPLESAGRDLAKLIELLENKELL